jgi:hypothetical protein
MSTGWETHPGNWKCVPAGMDTQVPGSRDTVSCRSGCRRHIWPRPRRMYQISSTQWCATARETWPAPSSEWAIPPRLSCSKTRTSEPSGATASRVPGSCMVSKRWSTIPSSLRSADDSAGGRLAISRSAPAPACWPSWSRGGPGVRRGTPVCGGTPGSEKIMEDRASAEDPGNGGVPRFPRKPDLPR